VPGAWRRSGRPHRRATRVISPRIEPADPLLERRSDGRGEQDRAGAPLRRDWASGLERRRSPMRTPSGSRVTSNAAQMARGARHERAASITSSSRREVAAGTVALRTRRGARVAGHRPEGDREHAPWIGAAACSSSKQAGVETGGRYSGRMGSPPIRTGARRPG
jgi:hypothetical protein